MADEIIKFKITVEDKEGKEHKREVIDKESLLQYIREAIISSNPLLAELDKDIETIKDFERVVYNNIVNNIVKVCSEELKEPKVEKEVKVKVEKEPEVEIKKKEPEKVEDEVVVDDNDDDDNNKENDDEDDVVILDE